MLFCREIYFVAIYALLCGEKLNQKLCLWRKQARNLEDALVLWLWPPMAKLRVTHWLTDSPTWVVSRDASASKKTNIMYAYYNCHQSKVMQGMFLQQVAGRSGPILLAPSGALYIHMRQYHWVPHSLLFKYFFVALEIAWFNLWRNSKPNILWVLPWFLWKPRSLLMLITFTRHPSVKTCNQQQS